MRKVRLKVDLVFSSRIGHHVLYFLVGEFFFLELVRSFSLHIRHGVECIEGLTVN